MIEVLRERCTGCRACEKLCPKHAIEMIEDENGFFYPNVDYEKCVKCGICKNKCPINHKETKNELKVYACFNKNEEIRRKSSSGGVFTIFADYIIENNGVVFGASFDKEFKVEHIKVENKEGIAKLRGSKYLQSNTNNTYVEAKEILEEGKLVYYSGTPCQIEGLYAYLGKNYENLITQDIICHGVPSPKVWASYLKYKNKKIDSVSFRSKENCTWQDYEVCFNYSNGKESKHHNDDVFMKLFLRDMILRESCYNCSFKKENRMADLTLADFWGIDNVAKELNDKKGTSLLILHSNKAKRLMEILSDKIIKKEVNFYEAIKCNPSIVESAKMNPKRQKVFKLLNEDKINEIFDGFDEL